MSSDPNGNGWVESYLSALLSGGLSSEYTGDVKAGAELIKQPHSEVSRRYYVSQLLREGELALHQTWRKATFSSNSNSESNDPRMAYLAWRVWFMKRALQKRERLREESSLEELSDDDDAVDSDDLPLSQQVSAPPPAPPVTPPRTETEAANKNVEAKESEEVTKLAGSAVSDAQEEQSINGNKDKDDLLPPPSAFGDGLRNTSPYLDADDGLFVREPPAVDYVDDLVAQSPDGLYVVLLSVHGLVRGKKMELGRDPDTGGQVKYVVELAKALSQIKPVYRVDLITRLVDDPQVDDTYARPLERIASGEDDNGGAFIVRLPCGPTNAYVGKEDLWPHVRELADNAINHVGTTLSTIKATRRCELYAIHGHYADAGDIASMMCATLGVDMLFTGHSLGRNKLNHLLKSGTSRADIEETYRISRRIEGEERALDSALMVVSSTTEEVDRQWGLYHGYNSRLEAALRYRKMVSRFVPRIFVIPPGLDFSDARHVPASVKQLSQAPSLSEVSSGSASVSSSELSAPAGAEEEVAAQPTYWPSFFRFLSNPHKPAILAMSRPDAKKNILALVKAFGQNPVLRDICNLVLVMGNRDDIDGMASTGSANVLTSVLKAIDAYDLYGSVAYPKRHAQTDISDIYHLPYKTRGVFANVALQEPFGLTIIEAAAHGVPVVATKWGGPTDILDTLKNGVLVEPTNSAEIGNAILNIVTHQDTWQTMSSNGLSNVHAYTWPAHCRSALSAVEHSKWLQAAKWSKGGGNKAPSPAEEHPSAVFFNREPKSGRSSDVESKGRGVRRSLEEGRWGAKGGASEAGKAKGGNGDEKDAEAGGEEDAKGSDGSGVPPTVAALERSAGSYHVTASESDITAGLSSASSAPLLLKTPSARGGGSKNPVAGVSRLVVVCMDDEGAAGLVAAVAKALREQQQPDGVTSAIAVASFLDLSSSRDALAKAGVDEGRDRLMGLVTRGGAELWTWDGSAKDWVFHEAYAHHIHFRWDAATTKRSLNWLKNRATGKSSVSGKSRGGWLAALRRWAGGDEAHFQVVQSGEHNHHLSLPAAKHGSSLAAPEDIEDRGGAEKDDNRLLAEDIRGKLRGKGVRASLALSYAEGGDGTWHITPLRATRALAARYLAAVHFGLSLNNLTTVAEVAGIKDGAVASASSDMGDLVGGVQRVLLARQRNGLHSGFNTPVSPYGSRVVTVPEASQLPSALGEHLHKFLNSAEPSRTNGAKATDEQSD